MHSLCQVATLRPEAILEAPEGLIDRWGTVTTYVLISKPVLQTWDCRPLIHTCHVCLPDPVDVAQPIRIQNCTGLHVSNAGVNICCWVSKRAFRQAATLSACSSLEMLK